MPKAAPPATFSSDGGDTGDLPFATRKPASEEASEFLRVMFFGQESTGKTTSALFMANAPGDGIVLVVSLENGVKIKPLRDLGVNVDLIREWPEDPTERVTFEGLEKLFYQCSNQLRKAPGSIKGVVFDTWSVASYALLEGAAEFQVERSKNGNNPRTSSRAIELQDYNTLLKDCRDIINKFASLPCHLAIVGQEADQVPGEGEFKGFKQIAVDVAGSKTRPLLYAAVDMAVRCVAETVVTGEYESKILITAQTAKSNTLRVKDRFHVLPPRLPEPRFDRLLDYYQEDVVASTDVAFTIHAETRESAAKFEADRKAAARGKR